MDLIQYWMPHSKSVKWMYVEYTQLDTWLMNTWIIRYSIYHRQTTKRCMWEIYLLLWKILTNWYKLLRLRNLVIFYHYDWDLSPPLLCCHHHSSPLIWTVSQELSPHPWTLQRIVYHQNLCPSPWRISQLPPCKHC